MADQDDKTAGGRWSRASLLAGLLIVVLHSFGLLAGADAWLLARLAELRGPPDRDAAPLLLAIDGATV